MRRFLKFLMQSDTLMKIPTSNSARLLVRATAPTFLRAAGTALLATWLLSPAVWAGSENVQTPRDGGASHSLGAPEINPAMLGGAIVLAVGGLLILTDRARRNRERA